MIDVELRLKDLASNELKQFNRRIRKSGQATETAFKQIRREAKKTVLALGKVAGGAAAVFIAFRAGQKILSAGFGFVDAASDAEEAFSKFSVVMGSEAARVEAAIDGMAKSMGRSRFQLIDFTASLQDTFVPMGFARDQAADLSLAVTQLAVDVASFSNRADADVIQDFTSALVGSSETVRKYGININAAKIEAEALKLGLVDLGDELDDAAKTAAIASLLFKGTTDAQGDALKTTKGWANQIKRLQATFEVLRVEVGNFIKDNLLILIEEMGGAARISQRVALGFKFVGVATVRLIRLMAALADGFLTLIENSISIDGFINAIGQVGISVEFFIREAIARFPQFADIIAETFNKAKLQLVKFELEIARLHNTFLEFPFVPGDAEDLQPLLNKLGAAYIELDSAALDLEDTMVGVNKELGELAIKENDARDALNKFKLSTEETNDSLESMEERIGKILTTKDGLQEFLQSVFEDMKRTRDATRELSSALGSFFVVAARAAMRQAIALNEEGLKPAREEAGSFAAAMMKVGSAINEHFIQPVVDAVEEVERLKSGMAGAASAVESYARSLSNFQLAQDFVTGLFQTFESGLARFSRDLVDGKANFGDFVKSTIKDIAALIIQFQLLKVVRAGLGISATGNVAGGGILGALGFEKGGVMQGSMGTPLPVNAYAHGGVASSAQVAVFGEGRGAEAFVPLPDGKNIPVKMEGGGGGATININMQSLDPTTAADVILQNATAIRQVITSALESGQDRKLIQAVRA